jgi:ubiquinol-cytochrome c reductase cytochrome c subunit
MMRVSVLMALGVFGLVGGAAFAQEAAGDAAHGRQVFKAVGCYECHGLVGQGSVQSGPRLAPDPMPLASLTQLLRQPLNQMPAYSDKALSDRDVADIHAYLASIPQPPPVKDIPLLNY